MNNEKFCMYCGQRLDGGARFCTMCGKLQVQSDEKQNPVTEDSAHEMKLLNADVMHTDDAKPVFENKGKEKAKAAFDSFSQKVKDSNFQENAKKAFNDAKDAAKQAKGRKKGKNNAKLFDDVYLSDREAAEELYKRNNAKINKMEKGLKLATVISILNVVIYFGLKKLAYTNIPSIIDTILFVILITWMVVGTVGTVASYIISGGILTAIKGSWKIAVFGWFVVPFFPIDLVIFFGAFFLSLFAFFFFPAIPIAINYKQIKKELEQIEISFGILR